MKLTETRKEGRVTRVSRKATISFVLACLATFVLVGLILDEYPDIEEQSLMAKMVTHAAFCRFVIVDGIAPSDHIKKVDTCHDLKFIFAVLRMQGRPRECAAADFHAYIRFRVAACVPVVLSDEPPGQRNW
jgi:hypothetical protein